MAPVSSSAPGWEDYPALIPVLIILKAAGIYITLLQAPGALQLPWEEAFLTFPLIAWWAAIATSNSSKATEASGQVVGVVDIVNIALLPIPLVQ